MEAERQAPIALFDMDGSIADYDAALRRDLSAMRAPCEPPILDEDNMHDLEDEYAYLEARMRFIKSTPSWWATLPRIEMGFTIVTMAREIGYAINILTKGPSSHPVAWKEKLEWCRAQPELSDAAIHITMDKGLVYGALFYDDFPPYMEAWLRHRPRGLGIMPVTGYNKTFSHPNVVKWDGANIAVVRAAMVAAYARAPREALIIE
ncbi:MAG: 5' nucleotidase, NT5C type [Vulcanimicrobiaceae bacterium]